MPGPSDKLNMHLMQIYDAVLTNLILCGTSSVATGMSAPASNIHAQFLPAEVYATGRVVPLGSQLAPPAPAGAVAVN
jgi:hypothetical protein